MRQRNHQVRKKIIILSLLRPTAGVRNSATGCELQWRGRSLPHDIRQVKLIKNQSIPCFQTRTFPREID